MRKYDHIQILRTITRFIIVILVLTFIIYMISRSGDIINGFRDGINYQ